MVTSVESFLTTCSLSAHDRELLATFLASPWAESELGAGFFDVPEWFGAPPLGVVAGVLALQPDPQLCRLMGPSLCPFIDSLEPAELSTLLTAYPDGFTDLLSEFRHGDLRTETENRIRQVCGDFPVARRPLGNEHREGPTTIGSSVTWTEALLDAAQEFPREVASRMTVEELCWLFTLGFDVEELRAYRRRATGR